MSTIKKPLNPTPNNPNPGIEEFHTGAVRRAVEPSLITAIPTEAILALGERYYYGAKVRNYGVWNWEKGIPYDNLIQHAATHLFNLGNQLSSPPERAITIPTDDTPRGNASAVMWGMACIIYFMANGNPAEGSDHLRNPLHA